MERILVVDDDAETSGTLKRLLERHGYLVREENDPSLALETTREFHPDYVLLDYKMPEVHGGDVAWQVASDPGLRDVHMIMCSGVAREEIRGKLPPVRIPILAKPVDQEELFDLLAGNDWN